MRRHHGLWARGLINRDSAFLSLLGNALLPTAPVPTLATCCNPLGTPRELVQDSPIQAYVSAVTMCGLIAKVSDDGDDERGWRRGFARTCRPLLGETEARAVGLLESLGFPTSKVRQALAAAEKTMEGGGDRDPAKELRGAVASTGEAYGEIVGFLGVLARRPESEVGALRSIGLELGTMIHLKDAWDDFDDDRRRGRPNPFPASSGLEQRREWLRPIFANSVAVLQQALGGISDLRYQGLIHSILIDGVGRRTNEMLARLEDYEEKEKEKQRRKREKKSRRERGEGGCCRHCDCHCCDCTDCSGCSKGCGKGGGSHCDCNPCDGDCCGCDCGCN